MEGDRWREGGFAAYNITTGISVGSLADGRIVV